jgi:hypothetical protein
MDGRINPNKDAETMIPPAKPRTTLLVFGPNSFLKKKTNAEPIVVENNSINKHIIVIVIEFI